MIKIVYQQFIFILAKHFVYNYTHYQAIPVKKRFGKKTALSDFIKDL